MKVFEALIGNEDIKKNYTIDFKKTLAILHRILYNVTQVD